jgi:hypothetical protein
LSDDGMSDSLMSNALSPTTAWDQSSSITRFIDGHVDGCLWRTGILKGSDCDTWLSTASWNLAVIGSRDAASSGSTLLTKLLMRSAGSGGRFAVKATDEDWGLPPTILNYYFGNNRRSPCSLLGGTLGNSDQIHHSPFFGGDAG